MEQKVLEKSAKKAYNPLESAEMMYQVYLPRLKMLANKLSAKSLRRLLIGLVEVPIIQEEFKDKDKVAKECYELGDRLLSAKSMLILHTLAEYEKSQQQQSTNEKEETNVGTSS